MFGIPNCGSVKKAKDWLNAHHIEFEFHDYKKSGISNALLKDWCQQKGWEQLINKAGTTYKNLEEDIKKSITTEKAAIALMYSQTSCIKRPIITNEAGEILTIRFDEPSFENAYL